MTFEMMLAQLSTLAVKFLIGDCMAIQDKYKAALQELDD